MENSWDEFSRVLEAKIQERVLPLEQQLSHQQEIITKLSQSLQTMLEILQQKNTAKPEEKPDSTKAQSEKSSGDEVSNHEEAKKEEANGTHIHEEASESA